MTLRIHTGTVRGNVHAPGSKSYTHRALVLGALASGRTRIHGALRSEDTEATLQGLISLGARIRGSGTDLEVEPGTLVAPSRPIDARNSGTTLRLLCGVASLLDVPVELTGDESLCRRPLRPLLNSLRQLRVECAAKGVDDCAPVRVRGPARAGTARLRGDVSSQFVSSLLLIGPRLDGGLLVKITSPLASAPYVEATREAMSAFGAIVQRRESAFWVPAGQSYRAASFDVPGDFSSAAFLLAAAAVTGGDVTVGNLAGGATHPDSAILAFLERFGAQVRRENGRASAAGGVLRAATVDLHDAPDLFPILSVVAAAAPGTSRLVGAPHLRHKESDRIRNVGRLLRGFGRVVRELPDGIEVEGGKLEGCEVDPEGDHRIAMAAAVAGLVAEGETTLLDPESVAVSYPEFFDDLRRLGASVEAGG